MPKQKKKIPKELTIKDLYPKLTSEQLEEAEFTVESYIKNALAIYERITADPKLYKEFKQLLAKQKKLKSSKKPNGKKVRGSKRGQLKDG